jgi:hypothetical protein
MRGEETLVRALKIEEQIARLRLTCRQEADKRDSTQVFIWGEIARRIEDGHRAIKAVQDIVKYKLQI